MKGPQLYCGIQNDRTEGLLRARNIPGINMTRLWWPTDTRREAFLPLFQNIDEHLAIRGGRAQFRSWSHAVIMARKIKDAARFAIDQWRRNVPTNAEKTCLMFYDVEAHQLKAREERGISRRPFVDDPRDSFLASLLIGQTVVVGREEYGADISPGFYRATRPAGFVTARGDDREKWGDPGPEFEAYWGAENPLIGDLLRSSRGLWAHCYSNEHEEGLKGATWFSFGYACAKYQQRQFELAGAHVAPHDVILVDWIYDQLGPEVEETMLGAAAAGWPGSFAVAGDWKSGADDSPQTPEAQADEIEAALTEHVIEPWHRIFAGPASS